jgi:hypothetical protein
VRRRIALFALGSLTGGAGSLTAAPAFADSTTGPVATVYVAPASSAVCSDTDAAAGTDTLPFCSVQAAVDSPLTGPGTTVLVGAGLHAGQVNITKSGTPGSPITIRSQSLILGQRAVLNGSGLTASDALAGLFTVAGQHDITIDGFNIVSGPAAGVSVTGGSSDVAVTRDFIVANATGVRIDGAGAGVTVSSDVIAKNVTAGTGVHVDNTAGAAVTGNTIEANCGYGIEIGGAATETTVENDVVEDNNQAAYSAKACASGVLSSGVQVWLASAGSTHLDYNVVYPYSSSTTEAPEYSVGGAVFTTAAALTAMNGLGAHDIVADAASTGTTPLYTPAEGAVTLDSADENGAGEYATDIYGNSATDDPLVTNTGTGTGTRDRGAVELTHGTNPGLGVTVDKQVGINPATITVSVTPGKSWTPPASYSYDFGDGTVIASPNTQMQHAYTQSGERTIWVTALDAQGHELSSAGSPPVNIWDPARPSLYLAPVYGNPMEVTADTSQTANAMTESIDFGDSSGVQPVTVANSQIMHLYTKPGPYVVTLYVTDWAGDPAVSTTAKFTATVPPPVTTPPTTPPPGNAPIVHRVAGGDRYATSIAASQVRWSSTNSLDGAPAGDAAQAVVLARGDAFPDALAGVPLATYKHGPLLLTDPASLSDATLHEIRRVLPADGKHTIYILGGASAVSATTEARLKALGYNVVRFGGADRYATALQIAHSGLGDPADIILATGDDFADALAAGPVASDGAETVNGKPAAILLSGKSAATGGEAFTDPATAAYVTSHVLANGGTGSCVNPGAIMAVGGPALSAFEMLPAVQDKKHAKFACVDGVVGKDRYATASQLAGQFGALTHVGVATGTSFPDALSGGAYQASLGQPLLLTDPASLPATAAAALAPLYTNAYLPWPRSVAIFGGPGAVSDGVRDQIVSAVHGRFQ